MDKLAKKSDKKIEFSQDKFARKTHILFGPFNKNVGRFAQKLSIRISSNKVEVLNASKDEL